MVKVGMTVDKDDEVPYAEVEIQWDGNYIHIGIDGMFLLSFSKDDWESLCRDVQLKIHAEDAL